MDVDIIYPMNAQTVKEGQLESLFADPNYIAEEKLDGSRYLFHITKEGGRLFSRQKSKKTGLPVEKTDNCPHLKEVGRQLYRKHGYTILDGEIVASGKNTTSNDVVSIVGSTPERALELQEERGFVTYVAFDVLKHNGQWVGDSSWYERKFVLENIGANFPAISGIVVSLTAWTEAAKRSLYQTVLHEGGEGLLFKRTDAPYIPGKRPTNTWLKLKKQVTEDVVITGYEPAEVEYTGKDPANWPYWEMRVDGPEDSEESWGSASYGEALNAGVRGTPVRPVTKFHHLGWIGAIRFGMYRNGELVELGRTSGMDETTRKYLSENQEECLGRVIEIEAMEQNKTGAFRHPRFIRFRDDKSATDCIWEG